MLLTMFVIALAGRDWSTVANEASRAILRLASTGSGACSVSVINREERVGITAAHCVKDGAESVTVDGRPVEIIEQNKVIDLALLRLRTRPRAELLVGRRDVDYLEEVAVAGYALGAKRIKISLTRVSDPGDDSVGSNGKSIWLDRRIVGGWSGGAVLDADGFLVSVMRGSWMRQVDHSGMGEGPSQDVLRDFTKDYWPEH